VLPYIFLKNNFYLNLSMKIPVKVYVIVNVVSVIINLVTSPGVLWFYWPILGWGIGLFFHGMSVFVFSKFPGKQWEERKIKEVMDKMNEDK